jgi:hypothetical protein
VRVSEIDLFLTTVSRLTTSLRENGTLPQKGHLIGRLDKKIFWRLILITTKSLLIGTTSSRKILRKIVSKEAKLLIEKWKIENRPISVSIFTCSLQCESCGLRLYVIKLSGRQSKCQSRQRKNVFGKPLLPRKFV